MKKGKIISINDAETNIDCTIIFENGIAQLTTNEMLELKNVIVQVSDNFPQYYNFKYFTSYKYNHIALSHANTYTYITEDFFSSMEKFEEESLQKIREVKFEIVNNLAFLENEHRYFADDQFFKTYVETIADNVNFRCNLNTTWIETGSFNRIGIYYKEQEHTIKKINHLSFEFYIDYTFEEVMDFFYEFRKIIFLKYNVLLTYKNIGFNEITYVSKSEKIDEKMQNFSDLHFKNLVISDTIEKIYEKTREKNKNECLNHLFETNYVYWKALSFDDRHFFRHEYIIRFMWVENFFKNSDNKSLFLDNLNSNIMKNNNLIENIREEFLNHKKTLNFPECKTNRDVISVMLLAYITGMFEIANTRSPYFVQPLNNPKYFYQLVDGIVKLRNSEVHYNRKDTMKLNNMSFNTFQFMRELHIMLVLKELDLGYEYKNSLNIIPFNLETNKYQKILDGYEITRKQRKFNISYEEAVMLQLEEEN